MLKLTKRPTRTAFTRVIARPSGTKMSPAARVWAWLFWINGGLHALVLIAVVIVLLRA